MGVMTCDCEPFEVCPSCAPAMAAGVPLPVEPRRYTLAEFEALARQWADAQHIHLTDRLVVSHLLAWLRRQEARDA